ncbi:MAG: toll/interleukin-1 receptor domain-containing protein [Ktedonobacterales bacterium]
MTTPTSPMTTTRAQRVFISHSHQDAAFSERVATALIAAGLDVWYDEMNMGVGHLAPAIEHELVSRDTFLLVLSPAALASQWVQSEWYAAWELLGQGKIRAFIPIIAERCEIPLLLRGMRWIDFTTQPFERALALLVKLLGLSDGSSASSAVIPDQWGLATTIRAHPVRGCFTVDWSRDGHKLASGSYDHSARIWDAATGACLQTLTGHTNGVDAVAWSPDSATLASASLGETIRLWDVATGQQRALLEGHAGGVVDVAWSPDGRSLVSGSSDQTVRVWDAASGRCYQVLQGHTGPITSVAWSPDGE